MAIERRLGRSLFIPPLSPEAQAAEDARVQAIIDGLPDASGTFTGTFASDGFAGGLLGDAPQLIPVEIDTRDRLNTAASLLPGQLFQVTLGSDRWDFPVDHVELLGGNVVRVWCHPPQSHPVE